MTNYQYLIIAGGMTAAASVDGIREVDATGSAVRFILSRPLRKSTAARLHIWLKFQEILKKATDQFALPQPIAKTSPKECSTMKTTTLTPELFRLIRDTVVILADVVSALLAATTA